MRQPSKPLLFVAAFGAANGAGASLSGNWQWAAALAFWMMAALIFSVVEWK